MYAVVELKWHQYIVKEGDTIVVDNMNMEPGASVDAKVLLTFDENGESVVVWKPYVESATVTCSIVDNHKGKKLRVLKFKRKNRYQRVIGFRAHQTTLHIDKVSS